MRKTIAALACLIALAGPISAQEDFNKETPAQIQAGIEAKHPAAYLILASKLFQAGDRDGGVFWFYLGQLRYRTHLAARPGLDPTGDPALFGSLFEVIGSRINQYAFGDVPALARMIDRALAWDEAHEDGFTPKDRFAAERATIRNGLAALRTDVLSRQDEIRATRRQNGLGNR